MAGWLAIAGLLLLAIVLAVVLVVPIVMGVVVVVMTSGAGFARKYATKLKL